MRRHAAIAGLLALVAAGGFAVAAPTEERSGPASWSGWITDETCGARNADGKACALKCHKNGARLVLYVEADRKLIGLDDQEAAARHVGHPVTVTGTENGVIKVRKIEEKKG